jgi:hypothetical protein
MPSKNVMLEYKPLTDKFTNDACLLQSLDMPDLEEISAKIEVGSLAKNKSTSEFYQKNKKNEIVDFKAKYTIFDNDKGRKLLTYVRELVEKPLKADYKVDQLATITLLKKDGKSVAAVRKLSSAVVISGEIALSLEEEVTIEVTVKGILQRTVQDILDRKG